MHWKINAQLPNDIKPKDRLSAILDILYSNRGLSDPKQRQQFINTQKLNPQELIKSLPDLDFSQLKLASDRILQAVKDGQPIIVYGDYDCDGVCSTAIIWKTLHQLGAKAMPFIPHRQEHGYGLSQKGLEAALKLFPQSDGQPLIITVDNGIRAHAAADYLQSQQIELIITDHHMPADKMPVAVAVVHTTKLCGAGVAWVLATQLTEKVDTGLSADLVGLVALATVCDQLPLLGPNRILVTAGLQNLRNHPSPGMQALFDSAQITDISKLDTYHLGFLLGPRINAAGRLGSAIDALRLLCTTNPIKAVGYAQQLNDQNLTRQELTTQYFDAAITHFQQQDKLPPLLFYHQENCPEGILGLLASKLTDIFARPSVVLSTGADYIKGSARSIPGINITDLFSQVSSHLVDFGGHELAAGLTTTPAQLPGLQQALAELTSSIPASQLQKTLNIEVAIQPSDITPDLLAAIKAFSPFGLGNLRPVFTSSFESCKFRIIGATGQHLKLNLIQQRHNLDAIGFNLAPRSAQLNADQPLNFAFTIEENEFRGKTTLQLNIKDFALP